MAQRTAGAALPTAGLFCPTRNAAVNRVVSQFQWLPGRGRAGRDPPRVLQEKCRKLSPLGLSYGGDARQLDAEQCVNLYPEPNRRPRNEPEAPAGLRAHTPGLKAFGTAGTGPVLGIFYDPGVEPGMVGRRRRPEVQHPGRAAGPRRA